jgi:hypothetical protein
MEEQYIFEAKHTKDSKDFACSTLSLWHLSRAFTLENHRWVRGTHFTDERSKLTNCRNFKNFFLDFSFLFFFPILDTKPPADAINPQKKYFFGYGSGGALANFFKYLTFSSF